MRFLAKIKHIPSNLPTGIAAGSGIKPFLYDKGERAVMAAGLGAIKGYYYDRAVFKGIGIEAWIGAAGFLGAALFGGPIGKHLERAGDVGMATYLYSLGASWGADKAGRGAAVTQKLPAGKKQVVGVIPPRSGGAFLTPDEMANYANPR